MNYTLQPKHKITLGSTGNALVILLMANAVLYVLLIFFKIFYFMTATGNVADVTVAAYHRELFDYFTLPASLALYLHRPWTLISYMFTHESLLELLSNLLWLTAFGYILQSLAANKKLIPVYLYGGVLGGIVFILAANFLPAGGNHISNMFGATAAVIAIATAAVTLAPRYKIFPMIGGGLPLWVLFIAFILISFSTAIVAGTACILAYAFAAFTGFFVIYQWKRGNDYCEWMYKAVYSIDRLFNPDKKVMKGSKQEQYFYKITKSPFSKTELVTQERIDELLDKIHQSGYKSLSKDEKEFLKRAGREDNLLK